MNSNPSVSDAWYSLPGPDNDVILSSRVRLARNIAGFTFPQKLTTEDAFSVQSLIFDSFNKISENNQYQSLLLSELDSLGQKILTERGVLEPENILQQASGIVLRTDGKISCCVNCEDHYRLSSFLAGFDLERAYQQIQEVDLTLQQHLQISASSDFGYLTSSFSDVGSGMKLSLLVNLQSVAYSGFLENIFKEVMSKGFIIKGYYGTGNDKGTSLGNIYLVSTSYAFPGSEISQLQAMTSLGSKLIEFERKTRKEFVDNKPTYIRNLVFRALALIKYSRFIESRESIDLLSKIKWGCDLGLIKGIEDKDLYALFYRIQNAHLSYVIKTSNLSYEKDVDEDALKIERLRSLILQEAMTNVEINV